MPYIKNTYRYKNVVEVERIHSGRYGHHGQNGGRIKQTPEEMQKVNERNCIKKLRRKIQANFDTDDLFLTLTYRRESRPDPAEARKRVKRLLCKLRKAWKASGVPLKYIIVTEYMNVSIHHHIVLNDLPDSTGPKKVKRLWKENGGTDTKYLYEDGQYERLAAYLVKETNKSFRDPKNPAKLRYSCSRNLIDPKPETKIMKSDDWPEEPRVPKNYYMDKLDNGINKRGYRYQYYRLIRLIPRKKRNSRKQNTRKGKSHGVKERKNPYKQKGNAGNQKTGS